MRIVCIIQARLSSERLPGKVLLQIPPESGVSMLEMVIRKCKLAKTVDTVVVVTPDKELGKVCRMLNVNYYVKGWPERDVLREYYEAAKAFCADVVVRVTADCALIQPKVIDEVVEDFLQGGADICYNTDEQSGQLDGDGSDVEIFSSDTLEYAFKNAANQDEHEHVTLFMRRHMRSRKTPSCCLGIRSVNTMEDYQWVCGYIKGT